MNNVRILVIPSIIKIRLVVLLVLASAALPVEAKKSYIEKAVESSYNEYKNTQSTTVQSIGSIEVAFSPNEGGEHLVLKVIESAHKQILILAYSFTSEQIVNALVRARARSVDVVIVADYKSNVDEDKSGKARAALNTLKTAGADVRTISVYPIHHDKVIIVDNLTVELGSFNYSDAAAHRNSENVFVNWSNPQLANIYIQHFNRNLKQSVSF